jgi:hypothetical protein
MNGTVDTSRDTAMDIALTPMIATIVTITTIAAITMIAMIVTIVTIVTIAITIAIAASMTAMYIYLMATVIDTTSLMASTKIANAMEDQKGIIMPYTTMLAQQAHAATHPVIAPPLVICRSLPSPPTTLDPWKTTTLSTRMQ